MSVIDTVERWLSPPLVERTAHRCVDCGREVGAEDASCDECGGEVAEAEEPISYVYWGLHY